MVLPLVGTEYSLRPTGAPSEAQYTSRSDRPTRSGPVRQDISQSPTRDLPISPIAIPVIPRPPVRVIHRIRPIRIRIRGVAIAIRVAAIPPPPTRKQQDQQNQAEHMSLGAGFQKPASAHTTLRIAAGKSSIANASFSKRSYQPPDVYKSTLWTVPLPPQPAISLDTAGKIEIGANKQSTRNFSLFAVQSTP